MSERLPIPADVLPHEPPMRLLDRLTRRQGECLWAAVDIGPDSAFYAAPGGVPAWVGLEYLSQTAAAMFGVQARAGGERPRAGMLVACRRYDAAVALFPHGATLSIRVWPASSLSGSLVRFEGDISMNGEVLASGQVSVYMGTDHG